VCVLCVRIRNESPLYTYLGGVRLYTYKIMIIVVIIILPKLLFWITRHLGVSWFMLENYFFVSLRSFLIFFRSFYQTVSVYNIHFRSNMHTPHTHTHTHTLWPYYSAQSPVCGASKKDRNIRPKARGEAWTLYYPVNNRFFIGVKYKICFSHKPRNFVVWQSYSNF